MFGISLGAAVAVATAALRDDIDGLILESPFADYRPAVAAHGAYARPARRMDARYGDPPLPNGRVARTSAPFVRRI
jgi:pimeloyl-ACP methyl ester carboxylesterase